MTQVIRIILLTLCLTGCLRSHQLKSVLLDLSNTPPCDNGNVFTKPKDTKHTLRAKVIVLNYKLDCHVDRSSYQQQKIKSYQKLN